MRKALSFDEIMHRAKLGMALNLGQLATATGYGYSTIQKWHKMGMPLIDGRITLQDAWAWRKAHAAANIEPSPLKQHQDVMRHPLLASSATNRPGLLSSCDTISRPPRLAVGRCGARELTSGSPTASRSTAARRPVRGA